MSNLFKIRLFIFVMLVLFPLWAQAEIISARYISPSDAYGHGAVTNGEYDALEITTDTKKTIIHHENMVFEDTAPRLVDLNGDGEPEVVVVASGFDAGARIEIYGESDGSIKRLIATKPIGQRNRWLAIAGIADLNGDGYQEIAYVDRPHLAKVLRVIQILPANKGWEWQNIANKQGFSNHQYGLAFIEGGIRQCDGTVKIITADEKWQYIMATQLTGGKLYTQNIGTYDGPDSLSEALKC